MSGWKLQAAEYKLEISRSETSGVKVWQTTPDGTDTLPNIGDAFNSTYPNCTAIRKTFTLLGDKLGNDRCLVEYGLDRQPQTEDDAFDDLLRTLEMSSEYQTVGYQSGIRWVNSNGSLGASLKRDLYRRIVHATVKIPRVYSSFDRIMSMIQSCVGFVNDKPFLGQHRGSFLCLGGTSSEFVDQSGHKRWRVEWVFEYRAPYILATQDYGGWNHEYNDLVGDFQLTSPRLYKFVNFKQVLFSSVPVSPNAILE